MRTNSTQLGCLLLCLGACQTTPTPDGGESRDSAVLLDVGAGPARGEWDKFRRSEPADLDGDGVADTSTTALEDGGLKVVIDLNHDGAPEAVIVRAANGDERAELFTARLRMREVTLVEPRTHITAEGRYGTLQERTTVTWPAKGTRHVKRETRGAKEWSVVDEEDLPDEAPQRCRSVWAEPTSCSKVLASALSVVTRMDDFLRGVTLSVAGADHVHTGSEVDLLAVVQDPQTGMWQSITLMQAVRVLAVGGLVPTAEGPPLRRVTLAMLFEEGETALLASHAGALHVALRTPGDVFPDEERGPATASSALDEALRQRREAKPSDLFSTKLPPLPGDEVGARIHPGLRAFSTMLGGAEHLRQGDYVDLLRTMKDPTTHGWVTLTTVQRAAVLAVGPLDDARSPRTLRPVTVEVLPEHAELLALAEHQGTLDALLRHPYREEVMEGLGPVTPSRAFSIERIGLLRRKRQSRFPCYRSVTTEEDQ